MAYIDLTRVLDETTPIYAEGDYADPPFMRQTWCTIAQQGYHVQRLCLGTQSGTHIDAPGHFVEHGAGIPVAAFPGQQVCS